VEFDPFALVCFEDPYPAYWFMLGQAPVYRSERHGLWALSRFEDVQRAARDWETFSSTGGVDLSGSVGLLGEGGFLGMDPPRHDVLRRVVRAHFTPKGIAALEARVAVHVDSLADSVLDRGECDLAVELARPLPVRMICALLGFPERDDEDLGRWFDAMVRRNPGSAEIPTDARTAADAMRAYIDEAAAMRASRPGDDVLSGLVASQRSREISESERTGICVLLFLAGISTAAGLISTGLHLLGEDPDQRAALVRDPFGIPAAVEELTRFVSPVQALARRTTRDAVLHDVRIPQGERILLVYGAANRDPRRFDDPDELDLGRDQGRHLGFGEGIHFCLGAPLARRQMRLVLERLLPRIPNYEPAGPVRWMTTPGDRGLDSVPVRF
jgi:cytochrome P450